MLDSSATADAVDDVVLDVEDAPTGLSRRSFVGRATVAGAAGALLASGALAPAARAADTDALPGLPSVAAVKARLEAKKLRTVDLEIVELAALLQAGELTSVELTTLYLERIDALNGSFETYDDNGAYGAFIRIDRDGALAGAKAADARLEAARKGGPAAPYLCGIPIGVKDSIGLKGQPAQNGSTAFVGNLGIEDPPAMARLREQGIVFLGHTVCSEYSSSIAGTFAGNAWNHRYVPGGSSQGSGVAAMARLAAAAIGEETGGSIIVPASANGASAIKPALGTSSVAGVMPLSPGVDVIGPIARSMADASLILNAMMGPDPINDPQTLSSPVTEALPITGRMGKPLAGLTIGVPQTDWMTSSTTAAPQTQYSAENLAAFNALRAKLQDLGATVKDFRGLNMRLPAENPYNPSTGAVTLETVDGTAISPSTAVVSSNRSDTRYAEAVGEFAATRPFAQATRLLANYGRVSGGVRSFANAAAFNAGISSRARREGERRRRQLAANYKAALDAEGVDFMLVATFGSKVTLRGNLPVYRSFFQGPNALAWPMVSFPIGFSADDGATPSTVMPITAQFLGPRDTTSMITQAALDYQAATDWHQRVPTDMAPLANPGRRRAERTENLEVDPLQSNDPLIYEEAMREAGR
ncbi:amidase [Patulibacter sp.]|uniref:amidase n=1 Tax=Patulibacter sp. TaxID=1912859 RepID=UPI002723AC2F|nr:amidase [Patulibacter sp.]MDO9407767.1 amidase [Patulibacter sp.]